MRKEGEKDSAIFSALLAKGKAISLKNELDAKDMTLMEANKLVEFLKETDLEGILLLFVGYNLTKEGYQRLTRELGSDRRHPSIETKNYDMTFRSKGVGIERAVFLVKNKEGEAKEPCIAMRKDVLDRMIFYQEIS